MNPNAPGFPLSHAIAGRPASISAYDWNSITARIQNGTQGRPLPGPNPTAGPCSYILLRNDNDSRPIFQGAAVPLNECLTPHYHKQEHSPTGTTPPDSFQHDDLAVFAGSFGLPKWPGHFCVALESIPKGKEGLAIYHGLAWAIWSQLDRIGNYNNSPDGLDLDLCAGYGGHNDGYLGRAYPGRAKIVWAPDIGETVPAGLDENGAYVLGLVYLGLQPPTLFELATRATVTTSITTNGNPQGYFQTWLPAFKQLTTTTPAWPFQRINDTTLQALVTGAYHLNYAATIFPGTLANPWPDNNPAKTLKHTYTLRVFLAADADATNPVSQSRPAHRFDVYPASTITAETWDVISITRGQYLKLSLEGYAPGAAAYGAVADCRFSGRLVNHATTEEEQLIWSETNTPI